MPQRLQQELASHQQQYMRADDAFERDTQRKRVLIERSEALDGEKRRANKALQEAKDDQEREGIDDWLVGPGTPRTAQRR